ncbi:MAG: amidohydrolase [Congregibacter sp.]
MLRNRLTQSARLLTALSLVVAGLASQNHSAKAGSEQADNTPDIIIHNARITTQNPAQPEAQAVAIKDGLIRAVGDNAEILALGAESVERIDANGRRVIPGLNDSHLHAVRGGRFYNLELRWEGVPSLREGLSMLREQAERTPKGQWVRVIGGWSPFQFEERRFPTLEELNTAAPDTPAFVLFLYSRGFLNRAGMQALGIDGSTVPPKGSRYERDADGNPTGLLIADPSPVILYQTIGKLPQLAPGDLVNSSRQFYAELNRFGLTSVIDAGGGGHVYPTDYEGSRVLAERGDMNMRVSYFLFPQRPGEEREDFRRWAEITVPGHDHHTGLAHGYETEGAGEFLTWAAGDYENFMAEQPIQSEAMEAELEPILRDMLERRWPFRIHATYDESVGRILNILEKLNRETPLDGLRWAIDHAETVTPANIARIKALGGGIAVQSRMAFAGENFLERYGKEAAAHAPPLRAILDAGVPLGAGSDATRVSSYNPWVALEWLVTGESIGGTPLLDKENQLTRTEALRAYTLGSAWFSSEKQVKGRIAPGQYADLAMLSEDYFTVDARAIGDIESVLTLVGGRVVHAAQEFAERAPKLPAPSPSWSPVARFGGAWAK